MMGKKKEGKSMTILLEKTGTQGEKKDCLKEEKQMFHIGFEPRPLGQTAITLLFVPPLWLLVATYLKTKGT